MVLCWSFQGRKWWGLQVRIEEVDSLRDLDLGGIVEREEVVSFPSGFVKFSNYLGMPVVGFKKEINSLLRKLELRKGRGVKVSGGKRKPLASSGFEREIQKLEC